MTIIPLFPLSHAFSPSLCVLPPSSSGHPKPLLLISVQFNKSISDQLVQSSCKFCFLQVSKYTSRSQPLCIFNSSMVKNQCSQQAFTNTLKKMYTHKYLPSHPHIPTHDGTRLWPINFPSFGFTYKRFQQYFHSFSSTETNWYADVSVLRHHSKI